MCRKALTQRAAKQQWAGSDRRIHHGICWARDAIQAASRRRAGCGMLDADFVAGFDYLAMS